MAQCWKLRVRTAGIVVFAFTVIACSGPDRLSSTETPEEAVPTATASVIDQSNTTAPEETPSPPGATSTLPESPVDPTASAQPPPSASPIDVAQDPTSQPDPPPATEEAAPPGQFDPNRVTASFERVGSGFDQPVFVTHAGDGSGRIFVLEKVGTVRLLDGTTILDIRDQVVQSGVFGYEHEQGMLGLAFHPRFEENGFLYVHYNDTDGDHVISRFTMAPDGDVDRGSEYVMLTLDQPEVNFQGGMLLFGDDDLLYVGVGTGGAEVDLQHQAQDPGSLYGKILRIDVDGGEPYAIPQDNPFVGNEGARAEVWAYGLRNPWRFSFDRLTGDLYIGGPGQFTEEWVDFAPAGDQAGQNYGWPMYEGSQCWEHWEGPCDPSGVRLPILTYPTYENGNCVVIGGYVYRGVDSPLLDGAYFFGDFCSGNVWAGWRDNDGQWQMTDMFQIPGLISSFGEDESGELYICDIDNGVIYHITGR